LFFLLQRDSSVDVELKKFVQPQVVAVGELYDIDCLYIVCEGHIICSIPQQRIIDSILGLLASFYVFNVVYNEGTAMLSFLEQALLGIGRGKTLVSVAAFFNAISNA
jgi:hydrogenase maturation factor